MRFFFFLLLLFSLSLISLSLYSYHQPQGTAEGTCTYTLFVKTAGQNDSSSTDSVISVSLSGNGYGDPEVHFHDLVSWGGVVKGSDRKGYFKRGDLDAFRGTGPCLPKPPCWMLLSSDGTGSHSAWLAEYVDVITLGTDMTGCSFHRFKVNQWLATDVPPYLLYAIVNNCLAGGSDLPERAAA